MNPLRAVPLILPLLMAGCGTQVKVWNPTTWFSQDQPERLITLGEEDPDPRPFMTRVESVEVSRYNGGIIVTAVGLPPKQGYWRAELRQLNVEDGHMVLEFRVAPPPQGTGDVGTPDSREVTVAYSISDKGLRDKEVTRITVKAQDNSISVRP